MSEPTKPSGLFDPLDRTLTPVLGFVLTALLAALTRFIPAHSPSDLHLAAVQAAEASEPRLSCNGGTSKRFDLKLSENARPHFWRVVGIVNRLGTLLKADGRQCHPAYTIDPPTYTESHPSEITRLTSEAIKSLDTIFAMYRGPDPPQSTLRNLEDLRSSLVRIAYTEGDINGFRFVVAATEFAAMALSFVYMFVTFLAIWAALPDGREWFHLGSLVVIAFFVAASFTIFATRDLVIAAYFLMILMLFAVIHAKLLATTLRESRYCHLLSFVRLLIWGASSYFIILSAVSLPYNYAQVSVGAYPFRMAKLNVANAFWAVSLLVFGLHLFRKDARSGLRIFFGIVCFALGPIASVAATGYYSLRPRDGGYPGNILYQWISDEVQPRAALIEIALPRLMISLPLIFVIVRRLVVRINDRKSITKFLADYDNPSASVPLELLPRFRVNLSRYGVLFPNSGACLPKIEPKATSSVAVVDTLLTPAPERGIAAERMSIAIDLLKSTRPVNVLMALILATVSYVFTSEVISLAAYAMLLVSVAFAVSGSFIVNDVADRSIDRINNPKRPVAAGTVTPRLALAVGVLLLSAAPLFALLVSLSLAVLCLVVCIASLFYSFYLKSRNGISANVLSAVLTVTLCFVGFDIANPSWPMVGISIAVFFAALAREIAKDVEDLPGDRLFRKSTLAITAGPSTATKTAIIVAGVQIAASYIPYAFSGAGSVYFAGITIANIILLRALTHAYRENAAKNVQRAVKLSMALYLVAYVALLSPMGKL